jgi:hypothetical protein
MLRHVTCSLLALGFASVANAAVIDTTDAGVVAAFQADAIVNSFESVSGATSQAITAYSSGVAVSSNALVFDQIPGARFSVGGQVGVNRPALFSLGGGIAGDARSPSTVLGTVDFDGNTNFTSSGGLMEIFFPEKVSKVGFWLNPSLGNVLLIAADTNFAFSGQNETTLETGTVTAGRFVGIERPTADIGGFKIIGLGTSSFTIDDLTTRPIPEPGAVAFLLAGLLATGAAVAGRRP